MTVMQRVLYPFSAIVGQEPMKLALMLNAIQPALGGVLIRGEKGTAKSTAARALVLLLPEIDVVADCPFQSHPSDPALMSAECRARLAAGEKLPVTRRKMAVIDLPLGATEDRVIGALNVERALQQGCREFEPGLLAAAHRGVLYVDEINLLEDHLVDLLLDSAAMGINVVQREGIAYSHPSRFLLIGTMNPEEGELRPQLLDRFGMCVDVAGSPDLDARAAIVERRLAFEADPAGFAARWQQEDQSQARQIVHAQQALPDVICPPAMIRAAAAIALELATQGHRAELSMVRTAVAIAALRRRREVTLDDIHQAARLVLPHRMRRGPFDEPGVCEQRLQQILENQQPPPPASDSPPADNSPNDGATPPDAGQPPEDGGAERVFQPGGSGPRPRIESVERTARAGPSGRRSDQQGGPDRGRYVSSRPGSAGTKVEHVAIDATLRAAARRLAGTAGPDQALRIERGDWQEKVRRRKTGNTIVFVIDSSGSMGARQRMAAAKGAVLALLIEAYQKRDKVALVAFRGVRAEVLLPPTASVELAQRNLEQLPTGGKTPFTSGLLLGYQLLCTERIKDQTSRPLLIIVSDGRANVVATADVEADEEVLRTAEQIRGDGIQCIVIDTETGPVRFHKMQHLATALNAAYHHLEEPDAEALTRLVREAGNT